MEVAGRAWDLFGSNRSAWNDGIDVDCECFGFRIYATWMQNGVEVLMQELRRAPFFARLTRGEVSDQCRPMSMHYVICEVTLPRCRNIGGWGMDILASVRAVKHWVSRWRRGLGVLRRRHASMVLAHKLPGVPEVVQHVHSFL